MAKHALGRGLASLLPGPTSAGSSRTPTSPLGQSVPHRGVNLLLRGGKSIVGPSAPLGQAQSNAKVILPEDGSGSGRESVPTSSQGSSKVRSAIVVSDVILVGLAVWLGAFSPLAGTFGGIFVASTMVIIGAGAGLLAIRG